MRRLLLRSLLIAVLVGPAVTFVLTVASMRRAVKYEPGISEDEIKSYHNLPVSELQALLKSREVKLTRYQWLRESIGYAYFWEGIALTSIRPCIGIFIGCVIIGTLERRRAIPLRWNDAAVPKECTLKRHWGRLLWVTITNLSIFVFSIYGVIGIHQQEILTNASYPPPPSFWTVFYYNPDLAVALVFSGVGLLLEALNRWEAALINCGLWLAVSIYAVAEGEPAFSTAVVVGLFAVDVVWYVLPVRRKVTLHAGVDNS
jgi:hypothetical protein